MHGGASAHCVPGLRTGIRRYRQRGARRTDADRGDAKNSQSPGRPRLLMPAFQPDWRKSAVRNDRGDDGNVSIIRSLVRAILLPGNRTHVRNLGSCRHPASETIPKWQNQGGGFGALQAPATILFLVKPALQGVWALGFALPPCGFQVARSLTVRERHWLQLDSNLTPIGTGRKRERHHSPRLRSWKFGFDFHTPPPKLL